MNNVAQEAGTLPISTTQTSGNPPGTHNTSMAIRKQQQQEWPHNNVANMSQQRGSNMHSRQQTHPTQSERGDVLSASNGIKARNQDVSSQSTYKFNRQDPTVMEATRESSQQLQRRRDRISNGQEIQGTRNDVQRSLEANSQS